jgi:FtsP/CotA-like multicopper oxidase with cupredoxin domain
MDLVMGFLGDAVAVNGVVNPVFKLVRGTYRFRLVNVSKLDSTDWPLLTRRERSSLWP